MSSQTILREYLLSLGFRVDTTGQRRFDQSVASTGKGAAVAGLAIGGLAATIGALAEQYAKAMERMYYASRKSGTTVSTLQGMEYAGERIGLAAGTMTAGVNTFAAKLRMNPGLMGMLQQMGVKTNTGDSGKEMLDMIQKTLSMSYLKGASVAALFGMDEQTYQVVRQNFDEYKKAMEDRAKMDAAAGVETEKNAKAMAEWGKQVTELKAAFQTLQGVIATSLLGPMQEVAAVTKLVVDDWTKLINQPGKKPIMQRIDEDLPVVLGFNTRDKVTPHGEGGLGKAFDTWRRNLVDKVYGPGAADKRLGKSEYSSHTQAELDALSADFKAKPAGTAGSATADAGHGFASQAERFAALEKMWGLTPGTLQTLRNLESADGKNMGSGKRNANGLGGIVGDFQMDSRARAKYGVVNPADEADAAAEMFADLKKQYGSDAAAAAAWNGGHAAGKYGPAYAVNPDETRPFVDNFTKGIQQTNNITINGGGAGVAGQVKQGLAGANGDLVRNLKTVVQ